MANRSVSSVVQQLRRTFLPANGAGLSDAQLLDAYLSQRDEAALAALVRRHGPMVWGVCRRVLHGHHDAEDAFQATFLVFIRKAASITSRELLANWLYGVAHRAALKARHAAARRNMREKQVHSMPEPAFVEPSLCNDVQPILDQELSQLPPKYRVTIVLCDLEGRTRKETAQQLRLPEGTVASRLARARAMLARRLARHGLGMGSVGLVEGLTQSARASQVPGHVLANTLAVMTANPGRIPPKVTALADAVIKTLLLRRFIGPALVLVGVLALVGIGAAANTLTASGNRREENVRTASAAKAQPTTSQVQGLHGLDQFHLHLFALVRFHLVQLHDLVSRHTHGAEEPDAPSPDQVPGD